MIGLPSIDQQIAAMAARWPGFRARRVGDRAAVWRGPLRPLMKTYEVEILYRAPLVIERIDPMRMQPDVEVLSPRLKQRARSAEGKLPHVYWRDEGEPLLCLFDPEAGEWSPADLLADTTVPWTIDWLTCYEGWRTTGEWTGGGRHPPPPSTEGATP